MNNQPDHSICFALYDSELRDEMFMLLELAQIKNYTQFYGLKGSSDQGKKEDSVSWPGSNEILMLAMSSEEKKRFKDEVKRFREERSQPPGLLVLNWDVKEMF